ncbi:MAG: mycofactocin biosynthesis peptidyl-dipeptidase MftE [Nocardioidaceae bacterium]
MRPLADCTWTDLEDRPVVLVPVGSIEQHGPHLPLDTDTVIAEATARGITERLPGAVVAPPLTYTASGEHQGFAGTSSIGSAALVTVVVELVRSLSLWAGRTVFVNAHGGNTAALTTAVGRLVEEGHAVSWVACATEGVDLHAGRTETSLMLHLRPESVRLDRAEPGNRAPLAELWPAMREGGVGAVSANGVLGDPTGASAVEGQQILQELIDGALQRL